MNPNENKVNYEAEKDYEKIYGESMDDNIYL